MTIEPITDIILLCEDDSTIIRPVRDPNSLSLSYSWFVDEGAGYTELTGEIGNSLSLTGVPATADGNKYRFVATHNADCNAEITDIELSVDVPPVVAFNTSFSFSNTEAAQEVLGGATPVGGVYSGTGVVDNGDGLTFTFDPSRVVQGIFGVTYTGGGCEASAMSQYHCGRWSYG